MSGEAESKDKEAKMVTLQLVVVLMGVPGQYPVSDSGDIFITAPSREAAQALLDDPGDKGYRLGDIITTMLDAASVGEIKLTASKEEGSTRTSKFDATKHSLVQWDMFAS